MVSCSGSSTLSTFAVMSVTSEAYSSSHSCVGAPGEGGVAVYPWSPGPVTLGRSCSRDARYSAGALAGFVGGVLAPQGVGQVCPGHPIAGRGLCGGILRAGLARVCVVACCALGFRRG